MSNGSVLSSEPGIQEFARYAYCTHPPNVHEGRTGSNLPLIHNDWTEFVT